METTLIRPHTTTGQPVSALSKLTSTALVGLAGALAYAQIGITGEFEPILTAFAVIMLLAAAMITRGWRFMPLVGAVLSIMVVAGKSGPVIYDLTHPESFHTFAFMVIAVALALTGTVAGIDATVQNYRTIERRMSPTMVPALVALVGVCAGAIMVAALPREASAGVSPEVLVGLPAITTSGFHFDQAQLRVKVGETVALRFDNPSRAPHSFDIDALNVHVPVAAGGSGLIMFKPTQPGTYTFYCQVPGHREAGMHGTLIVK